MVTQVLHERQVSISARSGVLRIAPHLYNTPDDAQALVDALHVALS
jgi:selenocysteine lyase/cysteine desulfurase